MAYKRRIKIGDLRDARLLDYHSRSNASNLTLDKMPIYNTTSLAGKNLSRTRMVETDMRRRLSFLRCTCHQLQNTSIQVSNKYVNCSNASEQNMMAAESGKIQTDNYRQLQLSHEMYVDDNYKLIYCPVPKVATSNWRRVLMVMGGRYNSTAEIMDSTWGIYTKKFKQLGSFDLEGRVRRLQTYTKIIFVRHPFERLLSAYRDKIDGKNSKIQTFQSFVRFVLSHQKNIDVHWQTYEELCKPCDVHYDIIGKYETFTRDANHVLRKIKADDIVTFPDLEPHGTNTSLSLLVKKYISNVTETEMKSLYTIYENDFKM